MTANGILPIIPRKETFNDSETQEQLAQVVSKVVLELENDATQSMRDAYKRQSGNEFQ
jgi:hypothetical protein